MNEIELIQSIIRELDSINVPVALLQQIGVPLFNANGKLKALLNAKAKETQKEQKDQGQQDQNKSDEKVG